MEVKQDRRAANRKRLGRGGLSAQPASNPEGADVQPGARPPLSRSLSSD
ncbi:MAG TPA: hypothetical protein VF791_22885 [Pyrinomonadaceae bacterium]